MVLTPVTTISFAVTDAVPPEIKGNAVAGCGSAAGSVVSDFIDSPGDVLSS